MLQPADLNRVADLLKAVTALRQITVAETAVDGALKVSFAVPTARTVTRLDQGLDPGTGAMTLVDSSYEETFDDAFNFEIRLPAATLAAIVSAAEHAAVLTLEAMGVSVAAP